MYIFEAFIYLSGLIFACVTITTLDNFIKRIWIFAAMEVVKFMTHFFKIYSNSEAKRIFFLSWSKYGTYGTSQIPLETGNTLLCGSGFKHTDNITCM